MFLLTRDRDACRITLERLRRELQSIVPGPLISARAGSHTLGWFRARRSDNLHTYRNGYLIGKLVPGEAASDAPIAHPELLPAQAHPLTRCVSVEITGERVRVRPHHVAGVFFDRDSVSDMQLLLADLRRLRPAAEMVAVLASVGYFPGDLTLFREIRRVPFLHSLVPGEAVHRDGRLPLRAWDDAAMVERLVGIVPRSSAGALAISGGCDSRFVMGLLTRAGVRTQLVRLSDGEDRFALRLAQDAGLPLHVVDAWENLPLPLYTVMTDGQIYSGGGHYSRLRDAVPEGALCYLGLFADSVLKNAFRAAWKNPLAGGDFEDRLILEALLSRMREREPGLRAGGRRGELLELLRSEVASTWEHGELSGRKQRANWFYYVHRGLRWTAAHTADLDFFAEVVLPLSDLEATACGILSSAWSNFYNARVRGLNRSLLPGLTTPYANGQPARVAGGPIGAAQKLFYEFGSRGLAHLRQKKQIRRPAPAPPRPTGSTDASSSEAADLGLYFDRSLDAIFTDRECSGPVRRAAATVNEVLAYLSSGAAPVAAMGNAPQRLAAP